MKSEERKRGRQIEDHTSPISLQPRTIPRVTMETSVWRVGGTLQRAGWRSATTAGGGPCVTISLETAMPASFVAGWAIHQVRKEEITCLRQVKSLKIKMADSVRYILKSLRCHWL